MTARGAQRGGCARVARCGAVLGCTLLCWLTLAASASAGPAELFVQLAFNPESPDVLAMRYVNGGGGLMFSRDGGKRWQFLCATAIEPTVRDGYALGVTKHGELLFNGQRTEADTFPQTLWQDDGHGCNFARVTSLETTGVRDIIPDPNDGDVLYAVTSGFAPGTKNGLLRRGADEAWKRVGPQEDALSFIGLRVVKTDGGLRFYTAAVRRSDPDEDGGVQTYGPVIRVSDDGGEHWTEHAFEPPTPRTSFSLDAIDPTDPDRIVASLRLLDSMAPWTSSSDEYIVSDDGGETFESILTVAEAYGAVFSPDGRLWLTDRGNIWDQDTPQGLWVAADAHAKPKLVTTERSTCVAYQPASDTLYACLARSVVRINQSDDTYEELMRAQTVSEFATCDGQNVAAACETQLCGAYCGPGHFAQAPLCSVYSGEFCGPAVARSEGTLDSGVRDASALQADAATAADASSAMDAAVLDGGSHTTPHVKSSCNCRMVAGGSGAGPAAWLLTALLLSARRRRRSAR